MTEPIKWESREELPTILNWAGLLGTGIEVGTQRGIFAEHVRRHWRGELLVCVDPWTVYRNSADDQETHDGYMKEAFFRLRQFDERKHAIVRKTSLEAAGRFAEGMAERKKEIDWVYLDGDHSYEAVLADIDAWWPLVRPGGVLAGHDYVPDGWHRNGEPERAYRTRAEAQAGGAGDCGEFGVIKAVRERFGDRPALTSPGMDGGWRSWLVWKGKDE